MSDSPRSCWAPRSRRETPMAVRGGSRPPGSRPATLEEFDFTFQRSVKKTVVEHLGQLDFLHARENVILLGPPDHLSHCPPRCRHWSNSPVAAPST